MLSACFHNPITPQDSTLQSQQAPTIPFTDDPTATPVDFDLDLQNFSFSPNVIQASPGDTIIVRLNVTQGFHDFVIDELEVKSSQIGQGSQEVIEITIPADTPSGTEYEFYCSIGNHHDLGMTGTLTVQ